MAWTVEFTKRARKDAALIRQARLSKKLADLLAVLEKDPFQNPPPYEKLGADLSGLYSRRINRQHRLVYYVDKQTKTVTVARMWTHYE